MNVKFLLPFVDAAYEVLRVETHLEVTRGELVLDKEPYVTDDVTVIISLVGQVEGNVFFSMSEQVALTMAARIMGEPLAEFDMLAQSGIAELGNVITGSASVKLSKSGYASTISPPTLLKGRGAVLSTLDYARLVVPLVTPLGSMVIHLALREGRDRDANPAKATRAPEPIINQQSIT